VGGPEGETVITAAAADDDVGVVETSTDVVDRL